MEYNLQLTVFPGVQISCWEWGSLRWDQVKVPPSTEGEKGNGRYHKKQEANNVCHIIVIGYSPK